MKSRPLPRDRETWLSCEIGQRNNYSCRLLAQHGVHAHSLAAGHETYRVMYLES